MSSFLAVIVVQIKDGAGFFDSAADLLLNGVMSYGIRRANATAHIEFIRKDKKNPDDVFTYARNFAQVVLIFEEENSVPEEVRIAADLYGVIAGFDIGVVKGAVYRLCRRSISDKDAEFVLTQPIHKLLATFRKGRVPERSLNLLRKAAPKTVPKAKRDADDADATSASIETLIGYGDAKTWGLRLKEDMALFRSGQLKWRDVDPGLLLSGPTGTGKTQFAITLARSCGLPLLHSSAAAWQSAQGGHLGDMLSAMRLTFKSAIAQAPCVLLIDEFDSLLNRDRIRGDYQDYSRQVINAALECLDGAVSRPGVVVIGTTNYPQNIDPAFLRPGRLDRHIRIDFPDPSERAAILQRYLGCAIPEDIGEGVALATEGWSGAQLGQLARDSRRRARVANRGVSCHDILAAMPEPAPFSQEKLIAASYHEAGHVVVGLAMGRRINRAHVSRRYLVDAQHNEVGGVEFILDREARRTREWYRDEICVLFGGIAAEVELLGAHDDGVGGLVQSDLPQATRLATLAEGVFAMGRSFVSDTVRDGDDLANLRLQNFDLHRRVEDLLSAAMARTRSMVRHNLPIVKALAASLVERERMTGDDIEVFLRAGGYEVALEGNVDQVAMEAGR